MIRARIILTAVATVVLMVLTSGAPALAAGPEASVQTFHEALISAMKDGRALGESGRYARLEPVIRRIFDIPLMSRLAIGASWTILSPAQRQTATAAFGAYITATYADRFDSYSGQRLEVIGQHLSGPGVIIKTRIVKSNGEPVSVDYAMRQNDGAWQISDVFLDGAISQLATQRSEFGAHPAARRVRWSDRGIAAQGQTSGRQPRKRLVSSGLEKVDRLLGRRIQPPLRPVVRSDRADKGHHRRRETPARHRHQ